MISKNKRQIVFERDNYTCIVCGSKDKLTIDHKIPVFEGGGNGLDNLQTMCESCNNKKGSKYEHSFVARLKKIWYIHNYFQNYKEELKGMVCSMNGIIKSYIQKIESNLQSKIDKQNNELKDNNLFLVGKINSLELKNKEYEKVILMLTDYLEIECVPDRIIKAKFIKRK